MCAIPPSTSRRTGSSRPSLPSGASRAHPTRPPWPNSYTIKGSDPFICMVILGIETSCDETSAGVVSERDGVWAIESNIVASQTAIHREWGGVVPELASRQHIRDICPVVRTALDTATIDLEALDAIAVTQGPGLVGSLLVGVLFAKSLALSLS